MIVLDNVCKTYSTGVSALNGVNLRIRKGEFVFIVGSSGSGKTTLFKLLLKELEPTSGRIYINSQNIGRLRRRRIPKMRRGIGVVFQDFRLLKDRNVYENIAFAQRVVGKPAKVIKETVPQMLALVGLADKAESLPGELSGGEQQRVSLARALVNNPPILLADEPTGNLDPANAWEIMKLLEDINKRGTTVVVVTHNRDIVERMQKRVITIDKGVVISDEIGRMFYAIRQGFKNIGRNRLFSLASVGTITACLFLFGIFYCIVANFQYMVHAAESNVGVTVFFDETVTEDKMLEIQRLIDAREEVSSTNYISADDAWENFKQDYFADGDEGILAGLDQDNPLVDCASVQVYLADTSRQAELISYIESLEGVSEVNASDIIADSFTNFSRLVFVAIFLISNTVMIGIAVRKEEIAIMKYIGATDLFVRGPFIVEGMTIGLIGSVIPVAILRALYPMVVDFVLEHFSILNRILTFMNVNDVFNILIPISLAIGLGIGFIGSYMTLRKHVRV